MYTINKPNRKRGFTLAEVVVVVAIIAILAGVAFVFINPKDISYVEYNRSAEAIATAVQNRLTEIRNAGDMAELRDLGEQATAGSDASGGYRYVFNYSADGGTVVKKDVSYILPFGTIDYELTQNYFAIGFQSDTGMVGEVFYSKQPIGDCSVSYLLTLAGDADKRKEDLVGYYQGTVNDSEVAFANLPTPQLTITNFEELTLSIYLPSVKQLEDIGKQIGILVSLSDKDGKAYSEKKLELTQTAIYSTFSLGASSSDNEQGPSVVSQKIASGNYTMVLDTVQKCNVLDLKNRLSVDDAAPDMASLTPPKGVFEDWAKKSEAYRDGIFLLGDNSVITVTVYCLYGESDPLYDKDSPVDPTYMPRSASVTFNGWFNDYHSGGSVDIACGRHLQNLGKLTEMRPELTKYLPTATLGADGKYTYGSYNSGSADAYTDGSSNIEDSEEYFYYKAEGGKGNFTKNDDGTYEEVEEGKGEYNRIKNPNYKKNSNLSYEDITRKYIYRDHVKQITTAKQINAIDFACAEWEGVDFTPVNLPYGFYYYGNYLTISNINVDAPFYAGLFGYVYHPHLYDILLVNPSVKSQVPEQIAELYEIGVGGLIGTSRDSSDIYNCQVYMTPNSSGVYDSARRVEGKCYVGGLIGFCEDEDIQNCSASVYVGYAYGSSELTRYVGGLLGCITGDSTVANCYAAGNLSGQYVGGLVGYIVQDTDTSGDDYRISTCYTAGHIEYASERAAGILGYVQEHAGNAKSALSVYGNYCVVIYGVKEGSGYSWKNTAPIYGTFEGDGVEWIRTAGAENSKGEYFEYYDTYFTGKYADRTFFAGAMFEQDNKNFYIAQKGISYADSDGSYYAQMLQVAQDFIDDANGTTDLAALKNKAEAVRQKVFWISKLQALEEMKAQMEQLIKDVESEPLSNDENATIWLEYDRSTFHTSHSSGQNEYEVTLLQAIYAIYNGTFTDTSGNKYENKELTYAGSTKDLRNTATGISTYTFMGFYNKLKDAFKTLVDSPNDEAALKVVTSILGEDDGTNTGDSSDTQFYKSGYMYRIFYERLLYGAFDHAKDIYQTAKENAVETAAKLEAEGKSAEAAEQLAQADENLKNELVMRHFRDDLAGRNFRNLAVDMGMSAEGRDNFLVYVKKTALQEVIDGKRDSHYGLNDLTTIMSKWKGDMADYKDNQNLVTDAVAKIQTLQNALDSYPVGSKQLDDAIKAAHDALQVLWKFFDQNKDTVDVVSPDGSKTGDMRNLRSIVQSYGLQVVWMCNATPNSGVMGALDELAVKADRTDVTAADLLNDFKVKINQYKVSDGGAEVRDAAELRAKIEKLAQERQDLHKSDSSFMYNYNEKYSGQDNPYRERYKQANDTDNHYVDADNNVYNNVFPYLESTYTRYYPFPFVFGRELENVEFQASFILFHYGDWLTEDLWAGYVDNVEAVVEQAAYQLNAMTTYFDSIPNSDTSSFQKQIDNLSKAIDDCITEVNDVTNQENTVERNNKLKSVRDEINGWLAAGGLFDQLNTACTGISGQKKEIAQQIINKLKTYREELTALIGRIDGLLG